MSNAIKCLGLAVLLFALMNEINGFYVQPDVINFISQPQSRISVLNSSVKFHCSINRTQLDASLPNVSLIWFHDGNLLNNSNNISCSSISVYSTESVITSTCSIESVQIRDQGWYQCRVIDGTNDTYCRNLPCISFVTASKTAHLKVIGVEVDVSDVYLASNATSLVLDCLGSESIDALIDQQIVWKRNEEFINNTDLAEILPSSNLLITSNDDTVVMNVIGTYECLVSLPNDSHIIISKTNVLLPQEYGVTNNKSTSLSLTFSPSNVLMNDLLLPRVSPVELVCLVNGLHSPSITWTLNDEPIVDASGTWISMNQWLPGNYCCYISNNGELTSSCLSINVIQSEPPLISTVFIDQSTTSSIELNCSSNYPVQWLHNGCILDHNGTSLNVLNKSLDELYGIYQCNRLNETIAIYRVLPFGWTNPVLSIYPVTHLPAFNLSLIVNSPLFTGGLNKESLSVNVTVEAFEGLSSDISLYTLTEPFEINELLISADFYDIEVTVVNDMKERISETTAYTFTSCELYEPIPPVLTLNCSEKNFSVQWKVSSLDPYPLQTTNFLNIQCYNASGQTISMKKEWSRISRNGHTSISPGDNTTVCHFTMHGERAPSCSGPTSTGICSHEELIIESSTVIPSSSIALYSLFSIGSSSTSIVTSSFDPTTSTAWSFITSITTPSNHASIQTTPHTPATSTVQTSYPSTVVNVSSAMIMSISIVALCSIIISILTVGLICFLAIWRYKRYKRRYSFQPEVQPPEIISVSDFDAISIETTYDRLYYYTSDRSINADPDDERTSSQSSPDVLVLRPEVQSNDDENDDSHTSTNTNSANNFLNADSNNSSNNFINRPPNHRIICTTEGSNSTFGSWSCSYLIAGDNGIELINISPWKDSESNDAS